MTVQDIIRNSNFPVEFPYVVRITDEYGESILEFESWEDEIPKEVLEAEVVWLNVVGGYGTMYNTPCMVIDIFQPEEIY